MKFVSIHYNNTVLGLQLYRKQDPDELCFGDGGKWCPEEAARELMRLIEGDCCVAFLEALSLEAQRSINRHAKEVFDNERWPDEKDLPAWAVKYQEAGL